MVPKKKYVTDLRNYKPGKIYDLGQAFHGKSVSGDEIAFNNYYMELNGKPFFGVSGEFHYSRMEDERWEDEIIKMKMGGINIVSTYVFWNHHEEEEGIFDFSGRRDLGKFIRLCKKHGLFVILRVGPFDHGEVRNGGYPDWLYSKPFKARTLSEGYLYYVRRLYTEIAGQVSGLFFCDGGPIIGVQIDNEYMHSSAQWEHTVGVSDEWIPAGSEGNLYMETLRDLALSCGLTPAFFTATAWGGAAVPDTMLPLWGGYAYRPWIFYSHKGEHPATEEYHYQNYHKKTVWTDDFAPSYDPESRPYACCEMGAGMTCCYYYRFQYPFKSVDALANIKIGSGCSFLGYYMFQGGSNPLGKHGAFLNESQVPRISYDYQAALGEFGQVRESYRRLKQIHCFTKYFGDRLIHTETVLQEHASELKPEDLNTLRYAVRTDGKRGFLFVNNFQDHRIMPDQDAEVEILTGNEVIRFDIRLSGDENIILPFHLDLDGIDLVKASAQPLLRTEIQGMPVYVFMTLDQMQPDFQFEEGTSVDCERAGTYAKLHVKKAETEIEILLVSRDKAEQMYVLGSGTLVFTEGALLEDESGIRLEICSPDAAAETYPAGIFNAECAVPFDVKNSGFIGRYIFRTGARTIVPEVIRTDEGRCVVRLPENYMDGLKDALLTVDYIGDIGHAYLGGELVSDNFCNGAPWEFSLRSFSERLPKEDLTLYISPLKEGANVNAETAMAARNETVKDEKAVIEKISVRPVYEIRLSGTAQAI